MQKNRLEWLDFGKAMGMLVVLLVHAGCNLGFLTFYGGMFYMPIFFVASGYTYHCKKEEAYVAFLKKKAHRLLTPYAFTSFFLWFFFYVKDSVLSGNIGDIKPLSLLGILYGRNWIYHPSYLGENPVLLNILNAPLWFLLAMFLTYAYYELLSRSNKKYLYLSIGLLCSIIWHYTMNVLLPWSLETVPYFACFFAVGEKLCEKNIMENLSEKKKYSQIVILVFAFLVLAKLNGSVNLSCGIYGKSMLLYLCVGSFGSICVFLLGIFCKRAWKFGSRCCSIVGQETLLILCLHMFVYSFLEIACQILGFSLGLTQAVKVAGSLLPLTILGILWKKKMKKRISDVLAIVRHTMRR